MPAIIPKCNKGKIKRLVFFGSQGECLKAMALTGGRLTEGKVTFPPDHIMVGNVLSNIPNTQLTQDSGPWYSFQVNRQEKILSTIHPYEMPQSEPGALQLFPHQITAVEWMKEAGRCILRSHRGLGKTVMGIAATKDKHQVLVTGPSSYVLSQWEEHIADWAQDSKVFRINGKTKEAKEKIVAEALAYTGQKYVLTTYKTLILPQYASLLRNPWEAYIVDEAHRIANRSTQQTQIVVELAKRIPVLYFLTGGDLSHRSHDCLWTMLNGIDESRFPSYWTFFNRYVESIDRPNKRGKIIIGPRKDKMAELSEILAPIRLNQTMEECGKNMPPIIESPIWIDLEPGHRQMYNKFRQEKIHEGINVQAGVHLFSLLRRLVNFPAGEGYQSFEPKTKVLLELMDDILSEGNKLLIWGFHEKYLRHLFTLLNGTPLPGGDKLDKLSVGFISGSVPGYLREKELNSFKSPEGHQVLIATHGTIGEGTNLPECWNEVHMELNYDPEVIAQCNSRCCRLTSANPVNVYYLLAKKTIDSYMWDMLKDKKSFISESNFIFKMIQMELVQLSQNKEE